LAATITVGYHLMLGSPILLHECRVRGPAHIFLRMTRIDTGTSERVINSHGTDAPRAYSGKSFAMRSHSVGPMANTEFVEDAAFVTNSRQNGKNDRKWEPRHFQTDACGYSNRCVASDVRRQGVAVVWRKVTPHPPEPLRQPQPSCFTAKQLAVLTSRNWARPLGAGGERSDDRKI
jgi:hypothetical protein